MENPNPIPNHNPLRYKQQSLTNEVLPEIPQKNLTLINNKLDLLVDLFEQNKDNRLYYNPNQFTKQLFYLYLVQKYNNQCYINASVYQYYTHQIRYIEIENMQGEKGEEINRKFLNKYAELLFECIKNTNEQTKIFVVPIGLRGVGHANLLIYRKESNQLEHFEPHGAVFADEIVGRIEGRTTDYKLDTNNKIRYIVDKINELNRREHVFDNDLLYIEPMLTCPKTFRESTSGLGFQLIQNIQVDIPRNIPGSCLLWSILIATLVLENPEVSTNNIQESIIQYTRTKGRTTPINEMLVKIIVGFAIYMVNTMDDYMKLLFMGSEFESIGDSIEKMDDILYKISDSEIKKQKINERIDKIITTKITNPYQIRSTGENIQELKEEIENNIQNIDSELSSINTTLQGLKHEMEPFKESYQTYETPTTVSGTLLNKLGLSGSSQKTKEYNKYKALQETYDELDLKRIALNFGKERLTFMLNTIEEAPMKEAAIPATMSESATATESALAPETEVKTKKPRAKKPPPQPLTPAEMTELEEYFLRNPYERMYAKTPLQKRKFYEEKIRLHKLNKGEDDDDDDSLTGGIKRKRVTKRKRITKRKRTTRKRVTKRN